jgi:mannosyltransferase
MTTVTPAPPRPYLPNPDLRLPARIERLPRWAQVAGLLVILIAVSAFIRSRYLSGQFWMDEALTTGIAQHPLAQIPGVLRHDGSPPLFYVLLHFWIAAFGSSEAATHTLSLICALLTIPVALWAGWSLFSLRAGVMAAVLFAFSSFLTEYGQETRMYALMALLGLIATAAYLHAFVFRRRKYLVLFALAQAAMLYTHAWGIFFGAGAVVALIPIARVSEDRRGLIRDAVIAFVAAGILFLPWLPTFIYQSIHTAAPWDSSPRFGAPVQLSRDLLGGDRVTVALLIAGVIGLVDLAARPVRRTRPAISTLSLILLPAVTLALAWIASQITPAWVSRYFAPTLGSILLLAAFGMSRARLIGWIALAASVLFLLNPASFTPQYKSNMRDVGAEMAPLLHQRDLVVTAQPEQIALMWYYLPSGLRFASTIGPVRDPTYMNWVNALARFRRARPASILNPLISGLRPGQQLLFVRPMTEGAQSWEAPWTQLIRRRAAQWGTILTEDVQAGILRLVAVAPHNYRGACCVADSAVLYRKVS